MEGMSRLRGRAARLKILLIAGLFAVFVRLVWLVADARQVESLYKKAIKKSGLIELPRGLILDREGEALAVDVVSYSIYANPSEVEDPERAAKILAPILGLPEERLLKRLSKPRREVKVASNIENEVAKAVRRLGLPFVRLEEEKVPEAYDVYIEPEETGGGMSLKLGFLLRGLHPSSGSFREEREALIARHVPVEAVGGLQNLRGVRFIPSRWRKQVDVVVEMDSPEAIERTLPALSKVLKMPQEVLKRKLSRRSLFCWLKRDVPESVASKVDVLTYHKEGKGAEGKKGRRAVPEGEGERALKGIGVIRERRRIYPNGSIAGQVIGFVNIDEEGLEGVERYYDMALRPGEGKWEMLIDGRGRPIPGARRVVSPAIPGFNVVLSLDTGLQIDVEEELFRACELLRPQWGAAIVLDPWTGEILAMANWPLFDPNRPARFSPLLRRNHAIINTFEPGSTFKVAVAAIALEERIVGPGSQFRCEGKWSEASFGDEPVTCWIYSKARRGHGRLSFVEALTHSCNVALARIALALGPRRLREWIEKFGFLTTTGVDFPGEPEGAVEGRWVPRKVASLGYGQGIRITLLSRARFFCAVANGGYFVKPRLAREIRMPMGSQRIPIERRKVLSERTCRILRRALVEAVEKGTGERAKVEGYEVAGKTGTADQVNPRTGRYDPKLGVASFVGFAPAHEPRVVVAVVLAAPKGPKWGGEVAAPIFARITRRVLVMLGVPPEREEVAFGPALRRF